jgi:hypothetical protein
MEKLDENFGKSEDIIANNIKQTALSRGLY